MGRLTGAEFRGRVVGLHVDDPWTGRPSWPPQSGGGGADLSRILVPFNGTAAACNAADLAARLSSDRPTTVWVLYVRPWDVGRAGRRFCLETAEEARCCAQTAITALRGRGVSTRAVMRDARREKVPSTIAAVAEALDVGCIVLGGHARPVWASVLLGSTSRSVCRQATRPVVLVYLPKQPHRLWAPWRPSSSPPARGQTGP